MTLLVRDEIDIIASSLDYHLAEGVDHVIVTDNGSRDGTVELLARYQSSGRLTLLHEPPSDFSQHRWVTRMARMAHHEFGADWVINADADEAFVCRGATLREALRCIPDDVQVVACARNDFVPFLDLGGRSPLVEMTYRKAVSLNLAGRALPPKVLHRGAADVEVGQGNHNVKSKGFKGRPSRGGIEVAHYPVRSLAQFTSKVRNGGSGYARNIELPAGQGFHKRKWYAQLCSGDLEREYRECMFFDKHRLVEALASGELVEDRTVADRMLLLETLNAGVVATSP